MSTKESPREQLHATVWKIAETLRGYVDGWDFKPYILGILFYRFISENLTIYINTEDRKGGTIDFDYSTLSDAQAELKRINTVAKIGFYILPSELFVNVRGNAASDENLNETLARIFSNIERSAFESGNKLEGLFDELDVNSSMLGNAV